MAGEGPPSTPVPQDVDGLSLQAAMFNGRRVDGHFHGRSREAPKGTETGSLRLAHPLRTDGEGGRGQIGEGHIGSPQRVHAAVRTAPAQWVYPWNLESFASCFTLVASLTNMTRALGQPRGIADTSSSAYGPGLG
jgi:hypothetical protein